MSSTSASHPGQDTPDPLDREALAWLVHLHSGDATEADRAAYDGWKAASDAHAAAAQRAESLWNSLQPALGTRRRAKRAVALLAIVGFAGIGLAAVSTVSPVSYRQLAADHRTATGEVRSIVLADGSVVDLDTGTSFDVGSDTRTLKLYAGQIFVKVAPDPSRPFRVVTDKAEVRALGTAFSVRLDADRERIVVTEHAVRVTDEATKQSVDVAEGEALEIGAANRSRSDMGKPFTADVEALLAWRQGSLHFQGQPFGTVVGEVERYRFGRVVVLDDDIRRLPITGSFDVGDTDSFLNTASVSLPVDIIRLPGLVVIRRDRSRSIDRGK